MRIKYANPTGGKAGKGFNKTSTIQVMDDMNCMVKQFRYNVGDAESENKALNKAKEYIK